MVALQSLAIGFNGAESGPKYTLLVIGIKMAGTAGEKYF